MPYLALVAHLRSLARSVWCCSIEIAGVVIGDTLTVWNNALMCADEKNDSDYIEAIRAVKRDLSVRHHRKIISTVSCSMFAQISFGAECAKHETYRDTVSILRMSTKERWVKSERRIVDIILRWCLSQ